MKNVLCKVVLTLLLSVTMVFPALAGQEKFLNTDGLAEKIPAGFVHLCVTEPSACQGKGPTEVVYNRNLWVELAKVNSEVNRVLDPKPDWKAWGQEDLWRTPKAGDQADCEDYALLKRKMLIEMGFPASALLIAVVLQTNGDGHAVLAVSTNRGHLILDNIESKILFVNKTNYLYRLLQNPAKADTMLSVKLDSN